MSCSSLLALVVAAGSLVFVPFASGRAASCGYYGCTLTVTVVQVAASTSLTGNPPYLNGAAEWKITPGSVDSCSSTNPLLTIVGPNAGAQTQSFRQGTSLYVYYTGTHAGIDTVRLGISVSACQGFGPYSWQYAGKTTYSVRWQDIAPTRGYCNTPEPPLGARSSATFWKIYRQMCVDDPVDESAGSYGTAVTDATVASPGMPFAFTRSYSSSDPSQYELGYGWHEPYGSYLAVNTAASPNTATATIGTGQQILFTKQSNGTWAAPAGTTATLSYANSLYTLTDVNHVKWQFSTTGMLTKIIDRNGQTATISGWLHWPTGVTLSNGKVINFTTNGSGRITKITLPDNRTVNYGYNSAGELTSVTDMRGGVTSYTYNSSHELLTVTDPRGHVIVTNVYGDYGRLASQTDAAGETTTYAFEPGGCLGDGCTTAPATVTATDPRGNHWTDSYDSNGLLVAQTDPLGDTSGYTYDSTSQLPLTYTDPVGNTVSYSYDSQQNPTQTTLPGSITMSATFDSSNNALTATNGRGYTTAYTYDTHGNPTLVTQPGGNTIGMAYNTAGQLTSVTDQAGKTTGYGYDSAGNLTSATTPQGNKTTYGYDTTGRRTAIVDPRGNVTGGTPSAHTTTVAYNAGDEVTSVTDQLGHTTTKSYDADGNLTSVTDPNNNTWSYTYDAVNRLTTVTAPDLSTTTYAYDQVGNLTSRTDANGNATLYAYDAANRLITITDALNRTWTLGYDGDSNLISVTLPSGGTIHYLYDALGHRTSTTYSDSTPSVSWTYDADGNVSSMTDGAGTVNDTYNQLDQLTQTTRGSDTFAYTYDPAGRIASRTYPDGTATSYAYTDDGNLTSATTGSAVTSYQYDPVGYLTQTTLPNGVVEANTFDAANRLTQLNDGFRTFAYGYDPAGNVTSRTVGGVTDSYAYDTLNRLTDISGGLTVHYGYDQVGNRTSMIDGTGTTSYSYNLGDQLQSATAPGGTTSYGFDQNGNETTAGNWNYTFNLAGQLTDAGNGSTAANYSYDGTGNRLSSTVGSSTTNYLWDNNFALAQLSLERDSSGNLIRRYTYGNGRISMTTPSTAAYYSTDAIGSVTELSGGGGTQLGQYDFNPFGDNPTSSNVDPSVAGNPITFAGEYQDPITGLYDLRARQYDPTMGDFLSPDPLGPQDYASVYAYVDDNPLGYLDPSGMKRTPQSSPLGCSRRIFNPRVGWIYECDPLRNNRCPSWACWLIDGGPLASPPPHSAYDNAQSWTDYSVGCVAGGTWGAEWGATTVLPYASLGGAVGGCLAGGAAALGSAPDSLFPDWP
jgi:RHS repeat-associated protein